MAIRILIIALVCLYSTILFADTTQNNTSGSNTSITGGYTNATTYESGSSSSSTTTSNSTSNIRSAPPTASAPNVGAGGMDICAVGASAGLQTLVLVYQVVNILEIRIVRELNWQENYLIKA